MKKKTLGALVLTLSSLVISAACATSKLPAPQPDSGETWAKAQASAPSRPANAASVRTARLASR